MARVAMIEPNSNEGSLLTPQKNPSSIGGGRRRPPECVQRLSVDHSSRKARYNSVIRMSAEA
jgi:hypothetical protein